MWRFTLCNYTDDDLEIISSIVPEACRFACIGFEICPTTKTPHLQGYLEFKSKKRPMSVFSYTKRIKWLSATKKGEFNSIRACNVNYCRKEGNMFLEHPKPKVVKTITQDQFLPWEKDIMCTLKEEPDDRKCYWYWSKKGGVGKTSFCKYLVVHEKCIVLGGKAADCRNGVIEYAKAHCGDTPERIIINIPRSFAEEYVSYEAFENLKDMIFYSGKYEGGMICGNCPHLFIFANFYPDVSKMSEDRWQIFNIDTELDSDSEESFE